jgi:hypothetical protein
VQARLHGRHHLFVEMREPARVVLREIGGRQTRHGRAIRLDAGRVPDGQERPEALDLGRSDGGVQERSRYKRLRSSSSDA